MIVKCPTDSHGGIQGCGRVFHAELDHEGLVDCPCGLFFRPRWRDRLAGAVRTVLNHATQRQTNARH